MEGPWLQYRISRITIRMEADVWLVLLQVGSPCRFRYRKRDDFIIFGILFHIGLLHIRFRVLLFLLYVKLKILYIALKFLRAF